MSEEREIEVEDQDDGGWNKINIPSDEEVQVEVEEEVKAVQEAVSYTHLTLPTKA